MTWGYLLKRYRTEQGLSQRALAEKAHVRQALISNVETGKKKDILSRTVLRLAQALGITVEQLLGQDVSDPYAASYAYLLVISRYAQEGELHSRGSFVDGECSTEYDRARTTVLVFA